MMSMTCLSENGVKCHVGLCTWRNIGLYLELCFADLGSRLPRLECVLLLLLLLSLRWWWWWQVGVSCPEIGILPLLGAERWGSWGWGVRGSAARRTDWQEQGQHNNKPTCARLAVKSSTQHNHIGIITKADLDVENFPLHRLKKIIIIFFS